MPAKLEWEYEGIQPGEGNKMREERAEKERRMGNVERNGRETRRAIGATWNFPSSIAGDSNICSRFTFIADVIVVRIHDPSS